MRDTSHFVGLCFDKTVFIITMNNWLQWGFVRDGRVGNCTIGSGRGAASDPFRNAKRP